MYGMIHRAARALVLQQAGEEAWRRADALFSTLAEDELVDPALPTETLLFRLFHEDGVRLLPAFPLRAACRCSPERVVGLLKSFPVEEVLGMVESDGRIHVTCEYCSRSYSVAPAEVTAER